MSTLDPTLEPKATTVRRLEVITGAGGRRRWSDDDKGRILEETLIPGVIISDVARRHGLRPQQLFTWRREAQHRLMASVSAGMTPPLFVPAIIEAPTASTNNEKAVRRSPSVRRRERSASSVAAIEFEIGGVTVRVGRDADAETIATVIRALKTGT